ncbi:MAG: PEP/pyruvate-binding domain-containing protein [bacterium]
MIHTFSAQPVPPLDQVGGKARSLIEATGAGFPVPDGFVLGVDFFREWIETLESGETWAAFLASSETGLRNRCDTLKVECARLRLAPAQTAALRDAVTRLRPGRLLAVRSSSPEEDLDGSSFAGEYETTLGVARDKLEDAIRHSFASVFDVRVVHYKRQRGMRVNRPRIAVVVQEQIASDMSGVAFSLNPLNNCYDEAVINANFGLGETVVAGAVTPDTWVVEKIRREIVERKIADKTHLLELDPDGGTRDARNDDGARPSLSDPQAIEVAELAARAETHAGRPMDIEWAMEDQQLYLLQSRPITTHLPLPEVLVTPAGGEKHLYLDLIVLSQGFEDSLSVLGLEYWGRMLEAMKGETMINRGREGTVVNVDGRQYIHLSNVMKGLGGGIVPRLLSSFDAATRRIVESIDLADYVPARKPDALKGMAWGAIKRMLGFLPRGYHGFRNPDSALRAYEQAEQTAVAECRRLSGEGRAFDELATAFLERFKGLTEAMVGVGAPPMFARWRLGRLFKDDDAADLLVSLEMDLVGNPTSEMGHRLWELASFPQIQSTGDGEEFRRRIEARDYSPDLMESYDAYMDRFGCRGIKEIDIATPRCYEDLPAFFLQLQAIDVANDTIKTARRRRADAYEQLLAIARQKGKARRFERLAKAHRMAGFREAPKYFFIITVDLLRRRALELGRRFVEEGRLDRAIQVFDLRILEIARAEREPDLDVRTLVTANLAPRRRLAHITSWPRVIDSRGRIFHAPPQDAADGLVGDAIAPGVVRGRAKVLHAPYEKPLLEGEILVTRASDPGWTPIFINAAGVVLEIGGALQHGAVIAREYGLPCVSGLDGATKMIQDGQLIEVDGSAGVVRVLPPDEEQAGT